jgi:hypothetical protein
MKGNQFKQSPLLIAAPVLKYQDRWEFCLDRKTHSYYWLGRAAQQDCKGSPPCR